MNECSVYILHFIFLLKWQNIFKAIDMTMTDSEPETSCKHSWVTRFEKHGNRDRKLQLWFNLKYLNFCKIENALIEWTHTNKD